MQGTIPQMRLTISYPGLLAFVAVEQTTNQNRDVRRGAKLQEICAVQHNKNADAPADQ